MNGVEFKKFVEKLKEIRSYTQMVTFNEEIIFASKLMDSYIRVEFDLMPELYGKSITNLDVFINRIVMLLGQEKVEVLDVNDVSITIGNEDNNVAYSFSKKTQITNTVIVKTNGATGITKTYETKKIFDQLLNKTKTMDDNGSVTLSESSIKEINKQLRTYRVEFFKFVIEDGVLSVVIMDSNKNFSKMHICEIDSDEDTEFQMSTLPSGGQWQISFYKSTDKNGRVVNVLLWESDGIIVVTMAK